MWKEKIGKVAVDGARTKVIVVMDCFVESLLLPHHH